MAWRQPYNAAMRRSAASAPLLVVFGLLLTALYPALILGDRMSPEASLKNAPPWRQQLGPYPSPSPFVLSAATRLGPRLESIARDGAGVALWNPWIGGGRRGWLAAPEEGGAPLPVLAAMMARRGWAWTALLVLELSLGFLTPWWLARRLGLGPWPSAVAGLSYGLSGAVVVHWLDWQGSALALGPLAFAPVLSAQGRRWRGIAAWAAVLVPLLLSGAPALPFIAAAACLAALSRPLLGYGQRWGLVAAGAVLALLALLPSWWLDRAAGEAGATPNVEQPGPPLDEVVPFLLPRAGTPLEETPATSESVPPAAAFLGIATLLLASLGVAACPARQRGFWLAVGAWCLASIVLPAVVLVRFHLPEREFGLLALVTAVLAAFGSDMLVRRLAPEKWAAPCGASLCVLVALILAPPAARYLPFAPRDEADLQSPVPTRARELDARMAAILDAMPPDVGAALGLADVRAAFFRREPRYASLLGPTPAGELPIARALSPESARLGLRWLVEPLPLHVISGEVFARADQVELRASERRWPDGLTRYPAEAPHDACRLGFPAAMTGAMVWLERPGSRVELPADTALAQESAAWQWFSVPQEWPAGPCTVAVRAASPLPPRLAIAWDAFGMRLRREDRGVRLWERDDAPTLAFLASDLRAEGGVASDEPHACTVPADRIPALERTGVGPASGSVTLTAIAPTAVEADVLVHKAALLAVLIKYRPALWHAEVNGEPAATERVNSVWSGVVVPAGRSHVKLGARLPLPVWLVAGAAVASVGVLAVVRRA